VNEKFGKEKKEPVPAISNTLKTGEGKCRRPRENPGRTRVQDQEAGSLVLKKGRETLPADTYASAGKKEPEARGILAIIVIKHLKVIKTHSAQNKQELQA